MFFALLIFIFGGQAGGEGSDQPRAVSTAAQLHASTFTPASSASNPARQPVVAQARRAQEARKQRAGVRGDEEEGLQADEGIRGRAAHGGSSATTAEHDEGLDGQGEEDAGHHAAAHWLSCEEEARALFHDATSCDIPSHTRAIDATQFRSKYAEQHQPVVLSRQATLGTTTSAKPSHAFPERWFHKEKLLEVFGLGQIARIIAIIICIHMIGRNVFGMDCIRV